VFVFRGYLSRVKESWKSEILPPTTQPCSWGKSIAVDILPLLEHNLIVTLTHWLVLWPCYVVTGPVCGSGLWLGYSSEPSLSVCELDTQPSSWEADTLPLGYRHRNETTKRKFRRQCLSFRRCYDVQLGRYWETNDTRKTIKLVLIIYQDFTQKFLSDFERRSNINRKQLGILTCLVHGRMSSLSFVQRTFDWNGCNGFVWRGKCRDWGTTEPQVRMPVNRGRRKIFRPLGIMFWT